MNSKTLGTLFIRAAAISALAAGATACATPNYDQEFAQINQQFVNVNSRLDTLDTRVADAVARADAAGQAANAASAEARAANQRVNQMSMQPLPPRSPRG